MFTGIVEERGQVHDLHPAGGGARLEIACGSVAADLAVGSSVAVDGCCVTAAEVTTRGFAADLTEETLRATCLGELAVGDPVNLERPVGADGRFGGHLVQGHVDGVGRALTVTDRESGTLLRVQAPEDVVDYLVPRGSVAVQGVSLTVTEVGDDDAFAVWLIPHTRETTTLGGLAAGDQVNLEADVIAKYVRRLLAAGQASPYAAPDRAGEDRAGEDRAGDDRADDAIADDEGGGGAGRPATERQ